MHSRGEKELHGKQWSLEHAKITDELQLKHFFALNWMAAILMQRRLPDPRPRDYVGTELSMLTKFGAKGFTCLLRGKLMCFANAISKTILKVNRGILAPYSSVFNKSLAIISMMWVILNSEWISNKAPAYSEMMSKLKCFENTITHDDIIER